VSNIILVQFFHVTVLEATQKYYIWCNMHWPGPWLRLKLIWNFIQLLRWVQSLLLNVPTQSPRSSTIGFSMINNINAQIKQIAPLASRNCYHSEYPNSTIKWSRPWGNVLKIKSNKRIFWCKNKNDCWGFVIGWWTTCTLLPYIWRGFLQSRILTTWESIVWDALVQRTETCKSCVSAVASHITKSLGCVAEHVSD
jgi:hypothetical protein